MRRPTMPWSERMPRSLEGISREMEGLMQRVLGGEGGLMSRISQPRADVSETEEDYEVAVDLPGLRPEEIRVEYEDGRLIVSGERKNEQEGSGKKFHRAERSYGTFCRTIDLPGRVDEARMEAEVRDGVLRVTLPKAAQQNARPIPIRGSSPGQTAGP